MADRGMGLPPRWPTKIRIQIWYPLFDTPAEVLISVEQLRLASRALRRVRMTKAERGWGAALADQIDAALDPEPKVDGAVVEE